MPVLRRTGRIGRVRLELLPVLPVPGGRRRTVGLAVALLGRVGLLTVTLVRWVGLLTVTLVRWIGLLTVTLLGRVGLLPVTGSGLRLLPSPSRRLLLLIGRRWVALLGGRRG